MASSTAKNPLPPAERVQELRSALDEVRSNVVKAAEQTQNALGRTPVLVAVSKYKPAEDVLACFEYGQVDFGENYVNELVEKAEKLPAEIQWHFIGTLQSNKCKTLAAIPNIFAIQTLDSAKKATALSKSLPNDRTTPLNVFIQINTSGEESKSGLPPLLPSSSSTESTPKEELEKSEVVTLAQHILTQCQGLHLRGLMTIGSFEQSTSSEPNQDFARLVETAKTLESILQSSTEGSGSSVWGVDGRLELSMGMSADYEQAITAGAGTVRVGTGIFGTRKLKEEVKKEEAKEEVEKGSSS